MSDARWPHSGPCSPGFTLIEVLAALVIFSLGVLMVLQLTTSLTRQMEYSAKTSEIVVRVQERIDSVEALPFTSLTLGTRVDTSMVRGTRYTLTTSMTQVTGLLYQVTVTMAPVTTGAGPRHSATSYAAATW